MTSTPPKDPAAVPLPAIVQAIHSTPPSAGTGANVSYRTHNTQEAYKPYLAVDIAHSVTIPFKDFLFLIFSLSQEDEHPKLDKCINKVLEHTGFDTLLKSYATTYTSHETARYNPFNKLVNFIIGIIANPKQDSIIICRNDPVQIQGSDGFRKPDCVVVYESAMLYGGRYSCDNLSDKGPKEGPFHWSELLTFVEFKLENRVASTLQTAPRPPKNPKPSQPSRRSKSGQEKSSSNTSPYSLRSGTQAPAAGPSTNTHSALPNASSNLMPNPTPSPHPSESGQGTSSPKRSGDSLETPSTKRRKDDKEGAEGSEPLTRKEVLIQCASYALEMLSNGGLYTHALGALITDVQLELLYYDRSLPIRSEPINFFTDPSSLVMFVYCMHHATSKQWGRVDKITLKKSPPEAGPRQNPFDGAILKLDKGKIVLELLDIVFVQHALIGRGTCVVRAKVIEGPEKWGSESIVVKFSFTPDTRISEGKMLKDITECAEKAEKDNWVLDHLPCVLYHEAFEADRIDKANIQHRLAEYFETTLIRGDRIEYEKRTLQVLVMTELHPIREITTANDLIPVIKDIFKCYRWLYDTAGVIHRDISENNLMYRKKADGTICGVLSDYDLSLMLAQQDRGPSSKQRTGTRPFMALDLLKSTPIKHLYRHDLESLFYVIIILMFRSRDRAGEKFENYPALENWFTQGPAQLLIHKQAFFSDELPLAPPAFQKLDLLAVDMKTMFDDGYRARARHGEVTKRSDNPNKPIFNESTLGGHVDFDKFQEILDSIQTWAT